MSAHLGVLQGEVVREIPRPQTKEQSSSTVVEEIRPQANPFAEEQILYLIHQVFCPGWPRPAKQVVFSAVDEGTDIAGICMLVGETLAKHVPGNIGVVETAWNGMQRSRDPESTHRPNHDKEREVWEWPGFWRNSAHQVSHRLWRVPAKALLSGSMQANVPDRLHDRLGELRLDFDYTILQGPPAGQCSDAVLFGQASDGVVLVLEANCTRRVTAQKVKERLLTANVRLLGAVLSGRTFPIPPGIYRRL